MCLRLEGLAELSASAAWASPSTETSRLSASLLLASPNPCLVFILSRCTGSYSLTPLYPPCSNSDPSPLAHPYPVIFHPLLLSPVVFHNNTPLPFLPPPPTARQAYLIPQPSSNQPTSLLVPQINNTDWHTHTHTHNFQSPSLWFLFPASLKQLQVPRILALCFFCFAPPPPSQRPVSDITVEVTAVTSLCGYYNCHWWWRNECYLGQLVV